MDLMKIAIIIVSWIIVTLLLAIVVPPFKENTSYSCVFQDGECRYPQDANLAFWATFAFTSLIFIIIAAIQFTSEEQNAYVMPLAEAWSRICLANMLTFHLPPLSMLVPDMTRDIEGGKKMIVIFDNPFDGYRRTAVLLNMMSDYNTTTTAPKQIDPFIRATRLPMSIPMQKQMLYAPDRDVVSRVAQLERTLERQGWTSGPVRELLDDKIEAEKNKLKQPVV